MKNRRAIVLILLAIVAFVGMFSVVSRRLRLSEDALADMLLPFNSDGRFIVQWSHCNETGEVAERSSLLFEEGTACWDWPVAYIRDALATEFAELMDSFSPVLVDAVAFCTVGHRGWLQYWLRYWRRHEYNPFRRLSRHQTLYTWGFFSSPRFAMDMHVHRVRGYGYLRFTMFRWDSQSYGTYRYQDAGSIRYNSLYRISPSDINRFVSFAEGLDRSYGRHTLCLCNCDERLLTHRLIGAAGLLIALWGYVLVYRNRRIGAIVGKFFLIPVGLMIAFNALVWLLHPSGPIFLRTRFLYFEWIALGFAVIAVVLGIYTLVRIRGKK